MEPLKELHFEMFFDTETKTAFFDGVVPWLGEDCHWHCPGIDPTLFPKSEVPMKMFSADHRVASKYFALAHRSGKTKSLPKYLLGGMIPGDWALTHFIQEDIRSHKEQETLAFTKLIDEKNYPALKWTLSIEFTDAEATQILQGGYRLLGCTFPG